MNNKKLFKGALVLFASILMAVSCSSNSNPDDGKGNGNENGGGTGDGKTEITKANLKEAINGISYTFPNGRAAATSISWSFADKFADSTKVGDTLAATVTHDAADATELPASTLDDIKKDSGNKVVEAIVSALNAKGFAIAASDINVNVNGAATTGTDEKKKPVLFEIKVAGIKKVKTTHKLSSDLTTFIGDKKDTDIVLTLSLAPGKNSSQAELEWK